MSVVGLFHSWLSIIVFATRLERPAEQSSFTHMLCWPRTFLSFTLPRKWFISLLYIEWPLVGHKYGVYVVRLTTSIYTFAWVVREIVSTRTLINALHSLKHTCTTFWTLVFEIHTKIINTITNPAVWYATCFTAPRGRTEIITAYTREFVRRTRVFNLCWMK